jgi:hypothetical protein
MHRGLCADILHLGNFKREAYTMQIDPMTSYIFERFKLVLRLTIIDISTRK